MPKGKLYICATPIGNLEDITLRVLRVLAEVDLIAAEDTRHTLKLLNHFEIKKPLTSYHENNKGEKGLYLLSKLEEGADIALVSDCGMPALSDPGRELINLCHEAGVCVVICPGASAGLSALVLSGFEAHPHAFEGFLPRDKKQRREVLEKLSKETRTMVFYEAPHRIVSTLEEFLNTFGGDRKIALVREITKKFEEIQFATVVEALESYQNKTPKGEFVVIVEEAAKEAKTFPDDLEEHLKIYIEQDMEEKEALKKVAKDRGLAKSQVYNQLKR
ncbi:MAG: 16S rRNA (cytidine(1402)-2'-O)-methyltransferase [Defluviitaleaceae bacterium]|nr:16S rRNA (cytidine(1402)-2'-O)-methyltransferase [Defluviitaleaceae bacterium]